MTAKIKDPLIELLAIKLYEHNSKDGSWPPRSPLTSWMYLEEDDRQIFRDIARGKQALAEVEVG